MGMSDQELLRYRGRHAGQRAFVIGNGPSLKVRDLERLRGEVSFACNKIYLAFPETSWRPTYYTVEDHLVAQQNSEAIEAMDGVTKFFPHTLALHGLVFSNAMTYRFLWKDVYPALPDFSDNAEEGFCWGSTVTYTMLQLACFMGIREIYLLGIDFDFELPSQCTAPTGKFKVYVCAGEQNHFHPEYRKPGDLWHQPNLEYQKKAFEAAKRYMDRNSGIIRNATRGGKLELFPRVDLSGLLSA